MTLPLVVGIPKNYCIIEMLEQEGIPYTVLNTVNDAKKQHIRVVVWEKFDRELVEYVNDNNNALITNMSTLAKIERKKRKKRWILTYHSPENSRLVEGVSGILINDKLTFIEERGIGYSKDCDGNVVENCGIIYRKDNRKIIAFPWDIFTLHRRCSWSYRPFFSPLGNNKPVICIGLKWDRGGVRRLLFNSIKEIFSLLSLPLVRLCPRPNKEGNYVIRIDSDGFSSESTEKVLNLSIESNVPFTWFIDVRGHGNNIGIVKKLSACKQDVQLHCYWHMTYPDFFRNEQNIKLGKTMLEQYKLKINGTASPYGMYNENFQRAVEANQLSYSSEFGFGVDDLPRWPSRDYRGALQVPVHPISIGTMEAAGFTRSEICEHWKLMLKRTIDMGYVCILYDHPLNRLERYYDEFKDVLEYCKANSWIPLTMTEYAKWWRSRTNIAFKPMLNKDEIIIKSEAKLNKVLFEIYPNGYKVSRVLGAPNYFISDETKKLDPLYVWGEVDDKTKTKQKLENWNRWLIWLDFRLFFRRFTSTTIPSIALKLLSSLCGTSDLRIGFS